MSHLSTIELEEFYNNVFTLLGEISDDKKLLKKLPDDISQRITKLLEEYKKPAPVDPPTSPVGPIDSRSGSAILPVICPADLAVADIWWSGNVEVKGLPKNGTKWIKFYMISTGVKLCFFPGKKKQLKAQILLGSSSTISEDTEDKKKSVYSIKDMSYPDVYIRFVSGGEGTSWYGSRLMSSTDANLAADQEQEEDFLLYDDCDALTGGGVGRDPQPSIHSDTRSLTPSVSSVRSGTPNSGTPPTRPDKTPSLQARFMPPLPPPPPPPDHEPEISQIDVDQEIMELDREQPTYDAEEPSEYWGEFEFSHVYQLEWHFNLSYHDTPQLTHKGHELLSINRGQLVHLLDRVNADWWLMMDCHGNTGYLPSCYLSLAYQ